MHSDSLRIDAHLMQFFSVPVPSRCLFITPAANGIGFILCMKPLSLPSLTAGPFDYEASVPEVTLPRQLHSSLHSKIPHGGFSSQLGHMQALPPYSLLCVPKLPQVKSPLTLYTCKPINSAGGDPQTYHAFKSHHGSDCATLQDSLNGCMPPSITMHTY